MSDKWDAVAWLRSHPADYEFARVADELERARAIIEKQRALLLEYTSKRNAGRSLDWEDHKPTNFTQRVRSALALQLDEKP